MLVDDEWLLDCKDELTRRPWFLPQHVSTTSEHGDFKNGTSDDWLHLRATTQVLHVEDPDDGFAIAAWANDLHPAGAFVWREGMVELSSSVRIHALRSRILDHFHNACLVQASLAHEVAEGWSNHEVEFFNGPDGIDIAVGRLTKSAEERRYGTGLIVLVR